MHFADMTYIIKENFEETQIIYLYESLYNNSSYTTIVLFTD